MIIAVAKARAQIAAKKAAATGGQMRRRRTGVVLSSRMRAVSSGSSAESVIAMAQGSPAAIARATAAWLVRR